MIFDAQVITIPIQFFLNAASETNLTISGGKSFQKLITY